MVDYINPIDESNRFFILDKYTQEWVAAANYRGEGDLERELIKESVNQSCKILLSMNNRRARRANLRVQF